MGLIRGVARTAAIAGTATAVSNGVSRRQAGRWAAQEPPAQPVAAPAPPPPAPAPQPSATAPPADGMEQKLSHLRDLGALREQGVLTDAEFEAQKARVLAS